MSTLNLHYDGARYLVVYSGPLEIGMIGSTLCMGGEVWEVIEKPQPPPAIESPYWHGLPPYVHVDLARPPWETR